MNYSYLFYILLLHAIFFWEACENNYTEKPAIIHELELLNMNDTGNLKYTIESGYETEDSIIIKFYMESSTSGLDTIYHSSSFPTHIAYKEERELTLNFEDQIIFDDLNISIIPGKSKVLLEEFTLEKYNHTSYSLVGVFKFFRMKNDKSTEHIWLLTSPITIANE
ncbi:MAG: hypothetical protein JXR20_04540 [Balneola sp.]